MKTILIIIISIIYVNISSADDSLLNMIPASALEDMPYQDNTTHNPHTFKRSIELIMSSISWQDTNNLKVPIKNISTPEWGMMSQFNILGKYEKDRWSIQYDSRLQLSHQKDDSFTLKDDMKLFIKEGYLSYNEKTYFIDLGRINQRYGVASGFNPTDYYRIFSGISENTIDPGSQRNDRLGTEAIRLTKLWEGSSASIIFSPDLDVKKDSFFGEEDITGLNLNRTNKNTRLTISFDWQKLKGIFTEGVLHLSDNSPSAGVNLSYTIGNSFLLNIENSLSYRHSLIDENIPTWNSDNSKKFYLQSAYGITYTSELNIATTLELHYNQAGMSKPDWSRWFSSNSSTKNTYISAADLWSIRQSARDLQEPLSKWQLFVRTSWTDALIDNLNINLIGIINPNDKSSMSQLEAVYELNDSIVFITRIVSNNGTSNSEHGSKPSRLILLTQLTYYF